MHEKRRPEALQQGHGIRPLAGRRSPRKQPKTNRKKRALPADERRRAEERQAFLAAVVECSQDAILTLDLQGSARAAAGVV